MRGMRQGNIDFLNWILGLGGANNQAQQLSRAGGVAGFPQGAPGGIGAQNNAQQLGNIGGVGGLGFPGGANGGGFGNPRERLESFFGPLGVPQTDLQRQSIGGMQQFLGQQLPQQRALEAINNILSQNPGQGMMDALQPRFQQNLAAANQQGARFSSGNAALRGQAVNDYNLLAQQALSQGVNQQIAAAQASDVLGRGIGDLYSQGFGMGSQEAGQGDIATQRFLQILMNLLGTSQSASFGLPITQSPGAFQNGLGAATSAAAILQALGGGGGQQRATGTGYSR